MDNEQKKNMEDQLRYRYKIISPYLNERSERIWAASEALAIGRCGNSIVHNATGISRITINKGKREVMSTDKPLFPDQIRRKGGGRKNLLSGHPELLQEIDNIVNADTRGDPESPLRWTCKSTRNISEALKKKGYKISPKTISSILHKMGFSLQSNRKNLEGKQHPDRDAQFNYINQSVIFFQNNNQPVISVDAKKKENIGNFFNNGKEWEKNGKPALVNTYDFPDKEKGKACPYGVFDILNNEGWVNVGISKDTAEFAVESIRQWWKRMGKLRYPDAVSLLITADGGGSNGYRIRLWKRELQRFSDDTGLKIKVCHFPPGTSKWNKIEHRLFSFISKNWRGKPLDSLATIVNLIENTTNRRGLSVEADIDLKVYEKGIKVSDEEFKSLNIDRDEFHGEWNYTVAPNK